MSDGAAEKPTNEAAGAGGYRVLARKYRPASFDDLIGQEPMVRTISNAFETGRIPQAWILTGVRGVGKTTTARILARALNYELPDGSVTGTLPISVVAKTNLACGGGSSNVFSSALKACVDSICTSSRM